MQKAPAAEIGKQESLATKEEIFRHGLDISRHASRGVYVLCFGKNRKHHVDAPTEVICTLYEGQPDENPEDFEDTRAGYSPITLIYQRTSMTLRPWNPYKCVIAAGLHNSLIHFPIRPKNRVFVLNSSLQTLSHIADVIGHSGSVIGVIAPDSPLQPTQEQRMKFLRRYPFACIIDEDAEKASRERYEQLLSLPFTSKIAFLMGLHPRLGAESPMQKLVGTEEEPTMEDAKKLTKHIFDFLECDDMGKLKCLIVSAPEPNHKADAIRQVVLSHIDIFLQKQKTGGGSSPRDQDGGTTGREDEQDMDNRDSAGEEIQGDSEDDHKDAERQNSNPEKNANADGENQSKARTWNERAIQWVMLDLPMNSLATGNAAADQRPAESDAHAEVVDAMKRLNNGVRTGLIAKEQLLLSPYFPGRALLLLKYMPQRDGRSRSKKPGAVTIKTPGAVPPPSGSLPTPGFLAAGDAVAHSSSSKAASSAEKHEKKSTASSERKPGQSQPTLGGQGLAGSRPPPPAGGSCSSGALAASAAAAAAAAVTAAGQAGAVSSIATQTCKTPQTSSMPVPTFNRHEGDMPENAPAPPGPLSSNSSGPCGNGPGSGCGLGNSQVARSSCGSGFPSTSSSLCPWPGPRGPRPGFGGIGSGGAPGSSDGPHNRGGMRGCPGLGGIRGPPGGGVGGSGQVWPADLAAQMGALAGPGAPGLRGMLQNPALLGQGFEDEVPRGGGWWGPPPALHAQQFQQAQQGYRLPIKGSGKGNLGMPSSRPMMGFGGMDQPLMGGQHSGSAGLGPGVNGGSSAPPDMDPVPYMAMSL